MPQQDAKRWIPPNSYIWRSNDRGAWMLHVVGRPRISASWTAFGGNSFQAMMDVVKRGWLMFMEDNEMHVKDCPLPDLFPS